FLFKLKAAWLFWRIHPHVDLPDDFWTQDDAKEHTRYLLTKTGRKWSLLMWRHIQSAAFRATLERNYAAFECGYASGCRGLMSVNDALLTISPAESESQQTESVSKGEADFLEQFSP